MKTNDLKKGDIVAISGGYKAEIMDNKKGNIRMVKTFTPLYEEMGSIYAWEILRLISNKNGEVLNEKIELTPAQEKAKEKTNNFLGSF